MSLGSRFLLKPEPLAPPEPWPATALIWLYPPEGPHLAAEFRSHPVRGRPVRCPLLSVRAARGHPWRPLPPLGRAPPRLSLEHRSLNSFEWLLSCFLVPPLPLRLRTKSAPVTSSPQTSFFFLFFKKKIKKKGSGGKYLTKCLLHFTSPLQVTRFFFLFYLAGHSFFFFFFFKRLDTGPLLNYSPAQIRKPRCWCFSGFHFPSFEYQKKSYRSCLQRAKQSTQGKCWAPHACRRREQNRSLN